MPLIETALGLKLLFALGILNLIGLALVFFSCRCLTGPRLANLLWKHDWYKKFYAKHCYYWCLFFASVLLHTVVALIVFGNPF